MKVISYAGMTPARRYFEEIEVGEEYESPGRTVTEADIVLFAGLSGDYNVLHTDAEFMKRSLFGERIAHGLLGLAIQSGLLTRATRPYATAGSASLRWKFKGPIRIGDTIRLRARVAAKKDGDGPGHGVIILERTVLNQRDEVVQEGETEIVVERRGVPGPPASAGCPGR
jgi:acyl dehydratase